MKGTFLLECVLLAQQRACGLLDMTTVCRGAHANPVLKHSRLHKATCGDGKVPMHRTHAACWANPAKCSVCLHWHLPIQDQQLWCCSTVPAGVKISSDCQAADVHTSLVEVWHAPVVTSWASLTQVVQQIAGGRQKIPASLQRHSIYCILVEQ